MSAFGARAEVAGSFQDRERALTRVKGHGGKQRRAKANRATTVGTVDSVLPGSQLNDGADRTRAQATAEDNDFRRRPITGSLVPLVLSINSTPKPSFERQATWPLWAWP